MRDCDCDDLTEVENLAAAATAAVAARDERICRAVTEDGRSRRRVADAAGLAEGTVRKILARTPRPDPAEVTYTVTVQIRTARSMDDVDSVLGHLITNAFDGYIGDPGTYDGMTVVGRSVDLLD